MVEGMKDKVISGLAWKFAERILAQVVTLIVSLCLARLLSPDDYGIVAIAMIVISVADVFVTSGFGNSLIQKKEADEIDFSTIFYFNIVFSITLYLVIYITAPYVANYFNNEQLTLVLKILGIRIPVAAINSVQQAYVSRKMLFKRFFWSTFFGTIISGVVGIWMAYNGYGIWALVAQYLTNAFIDTLVLWITVRWRPIFVFSFERLESLFDYGWKLVLSGVLNTLFIQIKNLVIGKKYTEEQLAFYTNGDLYPQALTSGINTTISSVLFPALSQCQEDKDKLKDMTRRAVSVSSYIMWPVMLGFAAVSPLFVKIILTEKWMPCVIFIQLACISYAFYPIHTANLEAIKAMGRSDLFLKLEIIKKAVVVLVLVITMNYGPLAIAVGSVVASCISLLVNTYPNTKLLNYSISEQISDVIPSLVKALVMAVVIYQMPALNMNLIVTFVLQILVGAIIYVIVSIVSKDKNYLYLLSCIRNRTKER